MDFTTRKDNDTAVFSEAYPTQRVNINLDTLPADANIAPAVMVINQSPKAVQVFYGTSTPMSNGAPTDFWIPSGQRALVSGFKEGDNTNSIAFSSTAWKADLKVPVDQSMENNMIYEVTIPQSAIAAAIKVEPVSSDKYYN